MFEQPLYEYEPVAPPTAESDLFHDYEIKGWASLPGLFKVLGFSAVVNVVALLVVGQTSLLTMKGCDSPLVGSVCQVLDTVYVGTMLFGTDREFVDVAYDRTELDDSEITFIDASKIEPPLYYPSNYFEIANPEQIAMLDDQFGGVTGFPNTPFVYENPNFQGGFNPSPNGGQGGLVFPEPEGEGLINTPQNLPKSNPNVFDDNDLPGSVNGGGGYNPPISKRRNNNKTKRPPLGTGSPTTTPEGTVPGIPDNPNTAENQTPSPAPTPQVIEPTAPVDAFNTRPLKDTLAEVLDLLEKKQLDLQAPINLLASGKFAKDGKIAKDSFKVDHMEGDKQLAAVVARAIGSLNDSNFLSLLKGVSGKNVKFLVQQDPATVNAAIESEMESDTRAQTIASLIKTYLDVQIGTKTGKITELEKLNDPSKAAELQNLREDLALMQSIQPSNIGNKVVVGFKAQKPQVQQWLQTRLAEQRAEPKPTDATGGVSPKPADPAQK